LDLQQSIYYGHHATKIITDQLDAKKEVGSVFLDLKKAFDFVNHDILTKTLEYCYLYNTVNINNTFSNE